MSGRQLTFKQYVAEEKLDPPVNFWWRGLLGRPDDLDTEGLLAAAGLSDVPLEKLASGYLDSAWQGHPRAAFVITTNHLFRPGDRYAISVEPALLARTGTNGVPHLSEHSKSQ